MGWREKVTRFVYLFWGAVGESVQRILCIYGQNLYGVVYRGTFIQGIR